MKSFIECIPVFNPKSLAYKREEKTGHLSFISNKHPEMQQLQLDEIAKFILDNCDGKRNAGQIINKIVEEYAGATVEEVTSDVFVLLHNLWRLGIVGWKNENPLLSIYSKDENGYSFRMLSEDETVEALKKYDSKEDNRCKVSPYYDLKLAYAELSVRQKVFVFQETFFLLSKGCEDVALFSIIVEVNNNVKSLSIGRLYIDKEFEDKECLISFINWSFNKLGDFNTNVKESTVLRFYYSESENDGLIEKLSSIGFKYLGCLKDEFGIDSGNVNVMDYYFKS